MVISCIYTISHFETIFSVLISWGTLLWLLATWRQELYAVFVWKAIQPLVFFQMLDRTFSSRACNFLVCWHLSQCIHSYDSGRAGRISCIEHAFRSCYELHWCPKLIALTKWLLKKRLVTCRSVFYLGFDVSAFPFPPLVYRTSWFLVVHSNRVSSSLLPV